MVILYWYTWPVTSNNNFSGKRHRFNGPNMNLWLLLKIRYHSEQISNKLLIGGVHITCIGICKVIINFIYDLSILLFSRMQHCMTGRFSFWCILYMEMLCLSLHVINNEAKCQLSCYYKYLLNKGGCVAAVFLSQTYGFATINW